MNDLYTQDRMSRNETDFGGSGAGSGHYTPQEEFKEKIGEIKLPLILLAFAALAFAVVLFLTIQEVTLYRSGTAAEATIDGSGNTGTFRDANGTAHVADIGWANLKNTDGTVTVYYKGTDYVHAQAITAWWVYLIAYLFFGSLVGAVIFWMYKILHHTKHAEKSDAPAGYRSKFDE